jgi:hypothetical protein
LRGLHRGSGGTRFRPGRRRRRRRHRSGGRGRRRRWRFTRRRWHGRVGRLAGRWRHGRIGCLGGRRQGFARRRRRHCAWRRRGRRRGLARGWRRNLVRRRRNLGECRACQQQRSADGNGANLLLHGWPPFVTWLGCCDVLHRGIVADASKERFNGDPTGERPLPCRHAYPTRPPRATCSAFPNGRPS